jgi:hypothetical protein
MTFWVGDVNRTGPFVTGAFSAAPNRAFSRWSALFGELTREDQFVVARTMRTCYLSITGRLISR